MPIGFTGLQAPRHRPDLKTAQTADPKSQPSLQMTHADEVCFTGAPKEEPTRPQSPFNPRRLFSRLWDLLLTPIRWPLAKFGFGTPKPEPAAPIPIHGKVTPAEENPFSATAAVITPTATPDASTKAFESHPQASNQPDVASPYSRSLYPGILDAQNRSQRFWNAIYAGQLEPIQEFIKQGIDVNVSQVNGITPLYEASARGNLPIVLALLESPHIQVDAADAKGTRAIHKAVIGNYPEVVDALAAKGADLEADSWFQSKPLQLAANLGYEEVSKRLIRHGAEVNGQSRQGYTPLYWAADHGHLNIVRTLLTNQAKVTITNRYGETPLHAAARGGYATIMTELLAAEGANPNAPDNQGETPLHRAASKDHLDVLEALVAKGGDLHLKSGKGVTPMAILEKRRAIREKPAPFDRLPL